MKNLYCNVHKVISQVMRSTLLKGDGGIYVLFILATVMLGSFALTGGLTPTLNPNPTAADQVQIDEESGRRSSEQALQLVDIKIKPTSTPAPQITETPEVCYDTAAIALIADVSGSMSGAAGTGTTGTKMDALKRSLNSLRSNFTPDTVVGLFAYSTNQAVLVPFGRYSQNESQIAQQIEALRPNQLGTATNTRQGLTLVYNNLQTAMPQYPENRFSVLFFTDGVPENAQCEFVDAEEVYRADNGDGPICAASFSAHPEHPGPISSQIKTLGARIYTVAIYRQPPYSSTVQNAIETIMKNVASNPDEQYYIGLPSASNLEQAYRTLAQRICQ